MSQVVIVTTLTLLEFCAGVSLSVEPILVGFFAIGRAMRGLLLDSLSLSLSRSFSSLLSSLSLFPGLFRWRPEAGLERRHPLPNSGTVLHARHAASAQEQVRLTPMTHTKTTILVVVKKTCCTNMLYKQTRGSGMRTFHPPTPMALETSIDV